MYFSLLSQHCEGVAMQSRRRTGAAGLEGGFASRNELLRIRDKFGTLQPIFQAVLCHWTGGQQPGFSSLDYVY
jgi:hypothetical protein